MRQEKIRVALLGLGNAGQTFAEHFLEQIQERAAPIEIVAVADHHTDSAVALGFAQNGVRVLADALDVVKLGTKVDIIFDLTGNSRTRQELRLKLLESRNSHTLIATETIVDLLWCFFDEPAPFKTAVGY
jgi:homoserine dehydrogenase